MQLFRPIRHALFSVSDKNGIIEFAEKLCKRGIKIISTNGTNKLLTKAGIKTINVSDHIKFPEIMNGRIKTLHLKLYAGILGRREKDDEIMKFYNITPIDMVVINLYKFHDVIDNKDYTLDDAFENIDIGGNSIIRAAAKNYKDVTVVIKNQDFNYIIKEMDKNNNSLNLSTRFKLATKAFEYTAKYDNLIANHLNKFTKLYNKNINNVQNIFPKTLNLNFIKKQDLRYGENNHQQASFYIEKNIKEISIATSKQIQGKMLSYNNIIDSDTAFQCVKSFNEPACVIVKHSNPCGVSVSNNISEAYNNAFKTDPQSAFGGIIAFNRELDELTSKLIINNQFVEVIIMPSINKNASIVFKKNKNIRLIICGKLNKYIDNNLDYKSVTGGLLVQNRDFDHIKPTNLYFVTKRKPTKNELKDALISWKVAKFVKSNAIVYTKNNMTIGIGCGQTSRIFSTKIANIKALDRKLETNGCTMASDAFFPFRDSIDEAATIGVTCIIQPGGSIKDNEIINAANEHNIAMILTKIRHFRH